MRYLYGDSVPFPPQYDFLAALEVFCAQAARIVRLEAESRALQQAAEEAALQRGRALDALEVFHGEAMGALRDGATGSTLTFVAEYVRQVGELAQRLVDDARRSVGATNDREQQSARAERDKRRAEVRDALEKLLVAVRLPLDETHVTMTLSGASNDLSAVFTYEGGLVASFTLAPEEVEAWRAPRHVSDFAQDVRLPVGVKRSIFKRSVAPEDIALDDHVLSGFELRDDRCELRLRRKLDAPDSLVFDVRRTEERVVAEVHHPDDAEAESGLPAVLDAPSAAQIERLWQLVRSGCGPVLQHKKKLVRLTLAGSDVFEEDLGTSVVALVIQVIAPILAEVAKRSPNQHELSLKVENDAGRREEIYLRKAQLVSALSAVSPRERGVFEPLGLIAAGTRESIESMTDEAIVAG